MDVRRVMLVDDERDIRVVAEIGLRDIGGFEVVMAASGPEALALLDQEVPDVLLLDMLMPGMSGEEILAGLRKRPGLRELQVIFLTAKADKRQVERYLALGALGVIEKPFDPTTLAAEVRRLVAPSG